MKFTIGHFEFESKKVAREACRQLLYSADVNEPLTGQSYDLAATIVTEYRAYKLAGQDIRYIMVRIPPRIPGQIPNRCLTVIREDGVEKDFTVYAAFHNDDLKNRYDAIVSAARYAVEEQRLALKRRVLPNEDSRIICPVLSIEIGWDEASVDHDAPWPFKRIFSEWLDLQVPWPTPIDRDFYQEFNPQDLASWLAFHNERAILRVISKSANSANRHNRSPK